MNVQLKALLDTVVAFAAKYPGEVPTELEHAVLGAYRNGLVDAARACQEIMRRHQHVAEHSKPGMRELFEADAAAHAAFECAELVLDKVLSIDAALRTLP